MATAGPTDPDVDPTRVYVVGFLPGVTKTNFHEAAGGAPDAKPPEAISQTAEEVVRVGMRALASRSSPTDCM